MSVDEPVEAARNGVERLRMRAGAADARAARRAGSSADDLFRSDHDRLDDRVRAVLLDRVTELIGGIERGLRVEAARRLAAAGKPAAADALLNDTAPLLDRLIDAGAMRGALWIDAIAAAVRLELLADTMTSVAGIDPDRPSLLVRLTECPDRLVAQAAGAALVADSRRHGGDRGAMLPADLYQPLVWQAAAALRGPAGDRAALDRALAGAATQLLADYDEGVGVEAAAMRLAVAIDARPDELAELLDDSVADRRIAVFVALLARAARLDFAEARAVVLDVDGARLWLMLRAHDVGRAPIARIAVALADGDPRRDLDAFADEIDAIAAIAPADAAAAIADWSLPADYRAACRMLGDVS